MKLLIGFIGLSFFGQSLPSCGTGRYRSISGSCQPVSVLTVVKDNPMLAPAPSGNAKAVVSGLCPSRDPAEKTNPLVHCHPLDVENYGWVDPSELSRFGYVQPDPKFPPVKK
jgi:hypothetical protein